MQAKTRAVRVPMANWQVLATVLEPSTLVTVLRLMRAEARVWNALATYALKRWSADARDMQEKFSNIDYFLGHWGMVAHMLALCRAPLKDAVSSRVRSMLVETGSLDELREHIERYPDRLASSDVVALADRTYRGAPFDWTRWEVLNTIATDLGEAPAIEYVQKQHDKACNDYLVDV